MISVDPTINWLVRSMISVDPSSKREDGSMIDCDPRSRSEDPDPDHDLEITAHVWLMVFALDLKLCC